MFQRILVPLDGSLRAEQAVPISASLARASGGSITLLRVVTHPRDAVAYLLQPPEKADTALEGQHAQAAGYLTRLASSGELAGVARPWRWPIVIRRRPSSRRPVFSRWIASSCAATERRASSAGPWAVWLRKWHAIALCRSSCFVRRKMRSRPFTIQKPLMLCVSWWL
jgi:hypothetical protein